MSVCKSHRNLSVCLIVFLHTFIFQFRQLAGYKVPLEDGVGGLLLQAGVLARATRVVRVAGLAACAAGDLSLPGARVCSLFGLGRLAPPGGKDIPEAGRLLLGLGLLRCRF